MHSDPFLHWPLTFSERNLLALLQVRYVMSQISRGEAERINLIRVDQFLSKGAGNALSDAFLARSNSGNNGLRTSSYHFLMHILTEMAFTGELNNIFHRNIACWVQSSAFMDAFVRCPLAFSQFVHPVASFLRVT